jgi:hypothetical protein
MRKSGTGFQSEVMDARANRSTEHYSDQLLTHYDPDCPYIWAEYDTEECG